MFKSFGKRPKSISPAETCTDKRSSRSRAVYIRDLYTGAGRGAGQSDEWEKETRNKGEGGFLRNSEKNTEYS